MAKYARIMGLNIRFYRYPDVTWAIRFHRRYIGFAFGKYYVVFYWNQNEA